MRKQAPVVAENVLAVLDGHGARAVYDGYGSCPLTVERGKVVLAEFGYGGKLLPTFPPDPRRTKPRRLAWLLKEQLLPPLYWELMLKGHEWLAEPKLLPHEPAPTRPRPPATTAPSARRPPDVHAPRPLLPALDWLPSYGRRQLDERPAGGGDRHDHADPAEPGLCAAGGPAAEVGLYASMLPLLAYALFGTSRTLAVGPVAVVSLMTAAAVGQVAPPGHARNTGAAALMLAHCRA